MSLRYISEEPDRHGNIRLYFRKRGSARRRLRAEVGTDAFMVEYRAALSGAATAAVKPTRAPAKDSLRWLWGEYQASPEFKSLNAATQTMKRRQMEPVMLKWGDGLIRELAPKAEQQNAEWLDLESEKLDNYAEDLERAFEVEIKTVEVEIKEANKALRGSPLPMAEKLAEKKRINGLQSRRDKLKREFFDRREQIRADVEVMLDQIQESLKLEPELTDLFTIRWEVA